MTVRRNPQEHEAHTGQPKFSLAETAVWPTVANHNEVRMVQLGAPETTRNTWPDIVSQVPVHRIDSPLLYPGAFSDPEVMGIFQPSGCTVLGGCLK